MSLLTALSAKKAAGRCFALWLWLLTFTSSTLADLQHETANPTALHKYYSKIFPTFNRNAASHLWSAYILSRSEMMTEQQLIAYFQGFCGVSGSPVNANKFNRYGLVLQNASSCDASTSGKRFGFMHYCCWPCVCDTQDFFKVDSMTIKTKTHPQGKQYWFTVLGDPCKHPSRMHAQYRDTFGRGVTTLVAQAPELKCDNGQLQGAMLSDNGYQIVAMFFDSVDHTKDIEQQLKKIGGNTPGRVSQIEGASGQFQHMTEYDGHCQNRADNGYNSGMGEIFRKMAEITPIETDKCANQPSNTDTSSPEPVDIKVRKLDPVTVPPTSVSADASSLESLDDLLDGL